MGPACRRAGARRRRRGRGARPPLPCLPGRGEVRLLFSPREHEGPWPASCSAPTWPPAAPPRVCVDLSPSWPGPRQPCVPAGLGASLVDSVSPPHLPFAIPFSFRSWGLPFSCERVRGEPNRGKHLGSGQSGAAGSELEAAAGGLRSCTLAGRGAGAAGRAARPGGGADHPRRAEPPRQTAGPQPS